MAVIICCCYDNLEPIYFPSRENNDKNIRKSSRNTNIPPLTHPKSQPALIRFKSNLKIFFEVIKNMD